MHAKPASPAAPGSRDADTPQATVIAGLLVAVLAAAGELLIIAWRRWSGVFTWTGADVAWMTPAGYLLIFAVPALIVAPLAGRRRWLPVSALVAGVGVGLGTMAVIRLLGSQRIHIAALLLFGLGIGVRAARMMRSRPPELLHRLLRRTLLVGVLGLLIGAGSLLVWQARFLRQRVAIARPAPPDAPNVLLLILDTVRAASLSLYGHGRPTTPLIDAWARRATVFDHAITTTSWTLPSHASMFTGRNAPELSSGWVTPLDGGPATLAEILRANGYRTGGFAANEIYTDIETGLARGFDRYRGHPPSLKRVILNTELGQWLKGRASSFILRTQPRKSAEVGNRELLDWIGEGDVQPFFGFLNYFDAHLPYHTPDSVRTMLSVAGRTPEERYDIAIRYLDLQIDALLRELDRRGILKNTLVIIVGDHGEQFGTHGLGDHGNSLYAPLLHVPLLMMLPERVPEERRIEAAVSLRNLPATILDVVGIEAEGRIPGTSWRRLWAGSNGPGEPDSLILSSLEPKRRTPSNHRNALGELRSIIDGSYHYISNGDGSEELYAFPADPEGLTNLVAREEAREPLARLRASLRQIDSLHPRRAVAR
jgi:arylsulfatase A-like enzyme